MGNLYDARRKCFGVNFSGAFGPARGLRFGYMKSLENQIAVVTGAGRGIGRAIALKFAGEGADVVVVSRTQENSEKVANEIRALGRKA